MKMRQGRKASTLITGFEPFQVVNAEDMAEDLRKICAGATSGGFYLVFFSKYMVQQESSSMHSIRIYFV